MLDGLKFQLYGRRAARRLDQADYHDLARLRSLGIVRMSAHGVSITEIGVDLHSRLEWRLKILIPIGTLFRARGSHQNMVATKEVVLRIAARGSRFVPVPAACMNAFRRIPRKDDRFGDLRFVDESVARFLHAARDEPPMTIQAGLWALTDGLDGRQIRERLTTRQQGARVRSSIGPRDIEAAALILRRLGLDTRITPP